MGKITIICFLLSILLFSSVVSAFESEIIKQDITTFEWSFKNPFNSDKESYKSFWNSYIDNFGCKDVGIKYFRDKYDRVFNQELIVKGVME